MRKLTKNEMKKVEGGAVSYTTAINAVIKAVTALFNVGQSVGSSIRRSISGKYCKA